MPRRQGDAALPHGRSGERGERCLCAAEPMGGARTARLRLESWPSAACPVSTPTPRVEAPASRRLHVSRACAHGGRLWWQFDGGARDRPQARGARHAEHSTARVAGAVVLRPEGPAGGGPVLGRAHFRGPAAHGGLPEPVEPARCVLAVELRRRQHVHRLRARACVRGCRRVQRDPGGGRASAQRAVRRRRSAGTGPGLELELRRRRNLQPSRAAARVLATGQPRRLAHHVLRLRQRDDVCAGAGAGLRAVGAVAGSGCSAAPGQRAAEGELGLPRHRSRAGVSALGLR